MKKYNANKQIVQALRKVWLYSPLRREALRKAFKGNGWYHCAKCGINTEKPTVDHCIPVVSPKEGFKDWDRYIQNLLFCNEKELDVLCRACHKDKTKKENKQRYGK